MKTSHLFQGRNVQKSRNPRGKNMKLTGPDEIHEAQPWKKMSFHEIERTWPKSKEITKRERGIHEIQQRKRESYEIQREFHEIQRRKREFHEIHEGEA